MWYWYLGLFLLGSAVTAVVFWLRIKNISPPWYTWVVGILGTVLMMFTLQNIVGTYQELYAKAALMTALFFGVPALVLLIIAWRLVVSAQHKELAK